jgi:phosphoribosylformylglycinamidine (FGAM) synthase-like enzyme
MDAKAPGDLVYLLGKTKEELGGSEYFDSKGLVGNAVPTVDAGANLKRYRALTRAIAAGLVASAHDCSDAGLGAALAETALAGDLGIEADLSKVPHDGIGRDDYLLFSESQGRFVVTAKPENAGRFEEIMAGTTLARVGEVTEKKRVVMRGLSGDVVVDLSVDELRTAWQRPLMF